MKIAQIDHRNIDFCDGLQDIYLPRLNRIVVLAGPNGSGKTRLLHRIGLLDGTAFGTTWMHAAKKHFFETLPEGGIRLKDSKLLTQTFKSTQEAITPPCLGVGFADLSPPTPVSVASFVAKTPTLTDSENLPPAKAIEFANQARSPGVAKIADGCLPHIRRAQGKWWDATHPNSRASSREKAEDVNSYEQLCNLVRIVLGTELQRNSDGQPQLFDNPIARAGLSDGQIVLLQWIVCLNAQGTSLRDIIVTMDEPENHLHPEAMIQAICRIIDANANGQIWIATHAVGLIASLWHKYPNAISLYCMKNGNARYAGRDPEEVLYSLMGGEENIHAVREFLDLPEILATNRFATECLFPPPVVGDASGSDPQVALVKESIAFREGTSKILDFGAGKGRLLDGLSNQLGESIKTRVDYVAWDVTDKDKDICLETVRKVFEDSEKRWYQDRNSLARDHQEKSFDVVVMCNVFHEVDPKDWLALFESTSVIRRCLKDDGCLLIVEDYLMPQGEYAHPYGFIVLDTEALKALFDCQAQDITVVESEGKYRERIRGHLVSKAALARVTRDSRKTALELANARAKEKIERLRSAGGHSFRSGQAHAFWVQQFANTTIALDDL